MPNLVVAIPMLNEAGRLSSTLASLDAQTIDDADVEYLLLDGGSSDGTLDIAIEWAASRKNARVCKNEGGSVAAALNLALELSEARFLAKVDAHCILPSGYLACATSYLDRTPEVMVVGGPMVAIATRPRSRPIAFAWNSRLASGAAPHRAKLEQEVRGSPVPLGVYRRTLLEDVGGYDSTLGVAEDDGLFEECWRRFGRDSTALLPSMAFEYGVRDNLRALSRQHFRYGRDKVLIWTRYGTVSARHALLLLASGYGVIAWARARRGRRQSTVAGAAAAYAIVVTSVLRSEGVPRTQQPRTGVALLVMHVSYAAGLWVGLGRVLAGGHSKIDGWDGART